MRKRFAGRWDNVWAEINLDAIHRPHLFYWNIEAPDSCVEGGITRQGGLGISWGDGNSDPVWSIELRFPLWLLRRLPESWG